MAALLSLAERLARRALHRRGWESRFVCTRAGRLHAYDAQGGGALPPVVLVHGLSSSGVAFARVMQRLRPHVRRVTTLELPGHGFSEPPREALTVERLFEAAGHALAALAAEPCVLVGNSMGGAVALRWAIDRPDRVRALALFSPAGARGSADDMAEVLRAFDAKTPREARALLARIYHKQPWFLPLVAWEFPSVLARRAIRDILASAAPEHAVGPEELARLSMPVTLVWGRSERLLPRAYLEYFREHLPKHARVLEPDAVGHCPHFDDPAGVAKLVLELAREAA